MASVLGPVQPVPPVSTRLICVTPTPAGVGLLDSLNPPTRISWLRYLGLSDPPPPISTRLICVTPHTSWHWPFGRSYPSHSHLMASVLGPVQPNPSASTHLVCVTSKARLVSTPSLQSLRLLLFNRNPNPHRLFCSNPTPNATSTHRAYAPNSSPIYSLALTDHIYYILPMKKSTPPPNVQYAPSLSIR